MAGSLQDQMARKLQAAARGYIARKTGFGAHKSAGKKHKPVKGGKHAKHGKPGKKTKTDDMQAKVIQAAFRKYSEYSKKH